MSKHFYFCLTEEEKEKIYHTIKKILAKDKNNAFAYVFGSFAAGERFRDIDIAIYRYNDLNLETEIKIEQKIASTLKLPVDVRIINKAPIAFIYHVIQEGKVILDHNPDLRADFQSLVLKKYFDFKHLRHEYLQELKNAAL